MANPVAIAHFNLWQMSFCLLAGEAIERPADPGWLQPDMDDATQWKSLQSDKHSIVDAVLLLYGRTQHRICFHLEEPDTRDTVGGEGSSVLVDI